MNRPKPMTTANPTASELASMLGRLGKDHPKTMTTAAMEQRRKAAEASAKARRERAQNNP